MFEFLKKAKESQPDGSIKEDKVPEETEEVEETIMERRERLREMKRRQEWDDAHKKIN